MIDSFRSIAEIYEAAKYDVDVSSRRNMYMSAYVMKQTRDSSHVEVTTGDIGADNSWKSIRRRKWSCTITILNDPS